ncbi:MAG TPA: O-antigen ligase family protein [Patescibacteria group bacterium]
MFDYAFLAFCALLPFQFALNPTVGIDLPIMRILAPVLFLIWAFFVYKKRLPLPKINRIWPLLGLFIFLAIFSLIFSHNLFWSLRKLSFLISLFLLYFPAFSFFNAPKNQTKALRILTYGAAALSLMGIIQFSLQFFVGIDALQLFIARHVAPFFLGNSFSQAVISYPSWLVNINGVTYMRAFAVFPDPHMFAYYLELLLPFVLVLWANSKGTEKKLLLVCAILIAVADILSFTRGSYLALLFGSLASLPLVSKQTAKKILWGSAALLFLFISIHDNPVASRLTSSFDIHEGSNQGRLSNWQQALEIISKHPLGVGIAMYPLAVDPGADYREPIYAHDLYFDIAAELGVETLAVFLALVTFAIYSFWKNSSLNSIFTAGFASLIIFSIHSLVETPLYSVHVLSLFVIILALVPAFNTTLNEKPTDA